MNAQITAPLLWAIHVGCPKNCTHCHRRSGGQFNLEATPPDAPQVTQEGGGDRVSGTDADRRENISHTGSSEFGGGADSAETADLRPCTH
jgi:hypothetical protein